MKPNLRTLIALFVLLMAGLSSAWGFTLSGTVYGGGTPLSGAVLTLSDASSGNAAGTATTLADGKYSFTVVDGTYNLIVTPPDGTNLAPSLVNSIIINNQDVTVNIVLVFTNTIWSGNLRGFDNESLGGYTINVCSQNDFACFNGPVLTAVTDSSGSFQMKLSPGSYYLYVVGSQFRIYLPNLTTIPAGTLSQDIQLPFVKLSGTTTDSNGVAVSGVSVSASGSAGGFYQSKPWYSTGNISTTSDINGNYSLLLMQNSASDTGYSVTIAPDQNTNFGSNTIAGFLIEISFKNLHIILPFNDTIAPVILSGPTFRSITSSSAVVEWQTNEPSRGSVKVGSATTTVTDLATIHSVLITGLTASTPYTAEVSAIDASGNGPTVKSGTFQTSALPDTVAPVILEGPAITASTATSLVVEWQTNEPAKGTLSYGIGALTASTTESVFTVQHRVELTGLSASSLYQVQVNASDAAGNGPTVSRIATGRTLPAPDTTAPVITNGPLVSDITNNTVTVTWKTDEPATGGVSWNDGVAYGVLTDPLLSTDHRAQITGLLPSTTYYLTVSSTDALGNGPSLSKTVNFTTQALADTTPPQILGLPSIVTITHQSAVIRWDTDEPADGQVNYGLTSLNQSESRTALIAKHTIPLVGLSPATTYQVQVTSKDGAGNAASSAVLSFTTLAQNSDNTLPVFDTPPAVGYTSDTKAVVQWKTDKLTDSQVTITPVNFDEPPKIKSAGKLDDAHEVSLTGLTPDKTYSVEVRSTDQLGNTITQSLGNFSTPPTPDSVAPVIAIAPSAQSIGATSVTIAWSTDKLSNSTVKYGPSGEALTQVTGDISYTRQHSVVLSKLKHSTAYQFQVTSTDPSGNAVQSTTVSFTTNAKADTTAPTLGAATVSSVSANSATISWSTDEPATSSVSYGTTSLGLKADSAALVNSHSITLTGLTASTRYLFTVSSADASGNKATSTPADSFDTTAPQAVTLSSIAISGLDSMDASSSANYSTTATYSDSSTAAVTPTWTITGTAASVNASGQVSANSVSTTDTVTLTASYQGQTANKTITIRAATTVQQPVSFTESFAGGWTLSGNGLATPMDVAATFASSALAGKVTTVWTWDVATSKWNFYSPALTSTQLADYAASKGYGVLTSIAPRQGYWVNAAVPLVLPVKTELPVSVAATDLAAGWNLVATGISTTPADFNRALSAAPPSATPLNFTTLWAWDNMNGAWYFYAPSLDAQGPAVLKNYTDSKSYLDFATQSKTLGLGTGFWVNR